MVRIESHVEEKDESAPVENLFHGSLERSGWETLYKSEDGGKQDENSDVNDGFPIIAVVKGADTGNQPQQENFLWRLVLEYRIVLRLRLVGLRPVLQLPLRVSGRRRRRSRGGPRFDHHAA
jgi:hypothetical protein